MKSEFADELAAKGRKERRVTELNLRSESSGTHPSGERLVVCQIPSLRSLRPFAASHRRFSGQSGAWAGHSSRGARDRTFRVARSSRTRQELRTWGNPPGLSPWCARGAHFNSRRTVLRPYRAFSFPEPAFSCPEPADQGGGPREARGAAQGESRRLWDCCGSFAAFGGARTPESCAGSTALQGLRL